MMPNARASSSVLLCGIALCTSGGCVQRLDLLTLPPDRADQGARVGPADMRVDTPAEDMSPSRDMIDLSDMVIVEQPVRPDTWDVSLGREHACVVVQGQVHCMGSNDMNQLGVADPSLMMATDWVRLGTLEDWRDLELGFGFACGLRGDDNQVWCWGADRGVEALGPQLTRHPVDQALWRAPIDGEVRVLDIGSDAACVITRADRLWCWGNNGESQLGRRALSLASSGDAVEVSPSGLWREVSVGDGHTCGLRGDGELWCWGRNTGNQCGQGDGAPGQITEPTRVGDQNGWLGVSSGQQATCALRDGGQVWCWGGEFFDVEGATPQERVSSVPRRVPMLPGGFIRVHVDFRHVCGEREGGEVWCWGRADEGQIGDGASPMGKSPRKVFDLVDLRSFSHGRFGGCLLDGDPVRLWCTGVNAVTSNKEADGRVGVWTTYDVEKLKEK